MRTRELDSMDLMGHFQLETFQDTEIAVNRNVKQKHCYKLPGFTIMPSPLRVNGNNIMQGYKFDADKEPKQLYGWGTRLQPLHTHPSCTTKINCTRWTTFRRS